VVKTELYPQRSLKSDPVNDLERTCMHNLLSSTEECVYFKDLLSRFLLVSAGWIARVSPGRPVGEVVGKTDFDFFSKEHAAAAFEDERQIMRTGEPIVGKLEQETFLDRPGNWVSSTKMPLRDEHGHIIGTFGISRDVTAQINAENALAHQALHDPVTGLANRIALMNRLSRALVTLSHHAGKLAVLFVDLDHFKEINDLYGHDAGDQVLAEVGRRLSLLSRRCDTVARLGGDEFVLLCEDIDAEDDVGRIGDRIVRTVRTPYGEDGRDLSITCSVGIVATCDPLSDPEELVHAADRAMYEAKKTGRNRYRVCDPADCSGAGADPTQPELLRAIARPELFVLYQPLFALETQLLVGVEALVRWRRPEHGIVPPDDFIPFAEEHGLMGKIGSFVLDEACRQLAEWTSRSGWPSDFTMAVNVSVSELSEPEFAQRVAETIGRHRIDPAQLCLEIRETAFAVGCGEVQESLSALSKLGVRLALNDFGTGYAMLANLRRLKVGTLKIDRGFVAQVNRSPRDGEIAAAVTVMSHALGMTAVGVQVETNEQLESLAGFGCDQGQGFLLARPMLPEAVVALVG
jgi:diguanylate cyclase (GGDEF)-like protein